MDNKTSVPEINVHQHIRCEIKNIEDIEILTSGFENNEIMAKTAVGPVILAVPREVSVALAMKIIKAELGRADSKPFYMVELSSVKSGLCGPGMPKPGSGLNGILKALDL